MADAILHYVPDILATAAGTVAATLVLRRVFSERARLVYWRLESIPFHITEWTPPVDLFVYTTTVQNVGRKPATRVQVSYEAKPAHFMLQPPLRHVEAEGRQGQFIIEIETLAPGEGFTLYMLYFGRAVPIQFIRCDQGMARAASNPSLRRTPLWAVRLQPAWGIAWRLLLVLLCLLVFYPFLLDMLLSRH